MEQTTENEEKVTISEEKIDKVLIELVAYNASLQVAHWKADTLSNEHKVLGHLYEKMTELTDELAEVYMGTYGVIETQTTGLVKTTLNKPATTGCDIMYRLRELFDKEEDAYILNIIETIQAELYRAKYLLKES